MTVSLHLNPRPKSGQLSNDKFIEPLSRNLLTSAVTFYPCGHIFNQETVDKCNKLCPLDNRPIESITPNYEVRALAENRCKQLEELDENELGPLGPDHMDDAERDEIAKSIIPIKPPAPEKNHLDESVGPQEDLQLQPKNQKHSQKSVSSSAKNVSHIAHHSESFSKRTPSAPPKNLLVFPRTLSVPKDLSNYLDESNSESFSKRTPSASPKNLLVFPRTLSVPKDLSNYLDESNFEEEMKRKRSVESDDQERYSPQYSRSFSRKSTDSDSYSRERSRSSSSRGLECDRRQDLRKPTHPITSQNGLLTPSRIHLARSLFAPSQKLEDQYPKPLEESCLRTFNGDAGGVIYVKITPNGKLLSISSESYAFTYMLWDIQTGKHSQTPPNNNIMYSHITDDGKKTLVTGVDGTIRLLDIQTGKYLQNIAAHKTKVTNLQINCQATRAISGSSHGTIKLWDLTNGKCIQTLSKSSKSSTCFQISPDGKKALTASGDFKIKYWDLEKGKLLWTFTEHKNEVTFLIFTPDGKKAISTASYINETKLWDLEKGTCLKRFTGNQVNSLYISDNGEKAITRSGDEATVLCLKTYKELRKVTCKSDAKMKVSPDGKKAFTASWDKTISFVDLETGKFLQALNTHTGEINYLEISPDSKKAFSCSWDNTIKLWDLETGQCLKIFTGHRNRVNYIVFTPDGKKAFSGSNDGTIKLWNIDL